MHRSGGEMKDVLLVDDDIDLCEMMKTVLESIAPVNCRYVTSLAALRALEPELDQVGLVILDINLGQGEPSGIDVYSWLVEKRFSGRIVFFTGHAQTHPAVQEASRISGVEV